MNECRAKERVVAQFPSKEWQCSVDGLEITAVAISNSMIAVALKDGVFGILSEHGENVKKTKKFENTYVTTMEFLKETDLVIGLKNGNMAIVNLNEWAKPEIVHQETDESVEIRTIVCNDDGYIAMVQSDTTLRVWKKEEKLIRNLFEKQILNPDTQRGFIKMSGTCPMCINAERILVGFFYDEIYISNSLKETGSVTFEKITTSVFQEPNRVHFLYSVTAVTSVWMDEQASSYIFLYKDVYRAVYFYKELNTGNFTTTNILLRSTNLDFVVHSGENEMTFFFSKSLPSVHAMSFSEQVHYYDYIFYQRGDPTRFKAAAIRRILPGDQPTAIRYVLGDSNGRIRYYNVKFQKVLIN